eukprot:GFYU01007277.1.p1 GENE.GFYU01007277.1~~GFYU01007277.1.p1  ORF type:complete len:508 (+),score=188.66 GFYU01007277.1:71-1525(+)
MKTSIAFALVVLVGLTSAAHHTIHPYPVYESVIENQCPFRGVVLSGGGDKGAWQVGAMKAMVEHTKEPLNWGVVAGVSVGSINGAGLSMYEVGQEKDAVDYMKKLWFELSHDDVLKNWSPGREAQGLISETALYDSSPLRNLLNKKLDTQRIRNSGRPFIAGAVSLETGTFEIFKGTDADIIDGVMASAAQPFAMPIIPARGVHYLDGGVEHISPITHLINSVKSCNLTDIDVISCHPMKARRGYSNMDGKTTLPAMMRVIDIMEDNANFRDFEEVRVNYPWVKLRVVYPPTNLETEELKFKHEDTVRMFEQGYNDGQAVMEGKEPSIHACQPKADEMQKASRSVKVHVINNLPKGTDLRLLESDAEDKCWAHCEDGSIFYSQPPPLIESGTVSIFGSHSCKMLRGTDGHAVYRVGDGDEEGNPSVIDMYWDNPYLGSREFTCTVKFAPHVRCSVSKVDSANAEVTFAIIPLDPPAQPELAFIE